MSSSRKRLRGHDAARHEPHLAVRHGEGPKTGHFTGACSFRDPRDGSQTAHAPPSRGRPNRPEAQGNPDRGEANEGRAEPHVAPPGGRGGPEGPHGPREPHRAPKGPHGPPHPPNDRPKRPREEEGEEGSTAQHHRRRRLPHSWKGCELQPCPRPAAPSTSISRLGPEHGELRA